MNNYNFQKEEGRGPSPRVARNSETSGERPSSHRSAFTERYEEWLSQRNRRDDLRTYDHECIFPLYYCHQIKYHRTYDHVD